MSDNIVTVYGEVPDLVEKKSSEMINKYLQTEKDDFNFIKFNLYETEITPIIEETLTMPFFSDKKVILVKNAYVFTGEKVTKELSQNT
ncbi:DNA polymerase III subunit delta, partial [Staphylococcus warneri]